MYGGCRPDYQDVENKHFHCSQASKRIGILDKADRISPMVYKILLQDILRDLVVTYANYESIEEAKAVRNDRILKKYHELSLNIMELAKACNR